MERAFEGLEEQIEQDTQAFAATSPEAVRGAVLQVVSGQPADETAAIDEDGALEQLPDNEPELLVYANRLLRDLRDVNGERAANAAAMKIEIDRVRLLYGSLDHPLDTRRERLERELARVYGALPQRGKAKSRKLAYGVCGTRTTPANVLVDDADALKAALKENVEPGVFDLIVRTVTNEKVDHRALVNFVAANEWAALPGTTVVPATEVFYARTEQ